MIFQIEIVPAATGNGGRNPLQYPRRGYFSSRRLNGGRSTVAPLSPFHMAVGPYRYLPRWLEATFANFLDPLYMFKIIFFKKNQLVHAYGTGTGKPHSYYQQINFDSLLAYCQTSTNAAFMQCM
jgi:hypothetical protein